LCYLGMAGGSRGRARSQWPPCLWPRAGETPAGEARDFPLDWSGDAPLPPRAEYSRLAARVQCFSVRSKTDGPPGGRNRRRWPCWRWAECWRCRRTGIARCLPSFRRLVKCSTPAKYGPSTVRGLRQTRRFKRSTGSSTRRQPPVPGGYPSRKTAIQPSAGQVLCDFRHPPYNPLYSPTGAWL
jgi:hypothetical protein